MRVYSDGNPTPFVNSLVRDTAPVWDQSQGESDGTFTGLRLQLSDSRTVVFLDRNEVKAIKAFAYLAE